MIEIVNNWYYVTEPDQYVLIHKYQKEKGVFGDTNAKSGEFVEKVEEVGYFKHLAPMLDRLAYLLCKEKIDAGEIRTLKEHVAELRKLRIELGEICDFVEKGV